MIGTVAAFIYSLIRRRNKGPYLFLFGVYISLVISITLFPISFSEIGKGPDIILNPLESWKVMTSEGLFIFLKQAGGNIIMFMPLPFFLIMIYGKRMDNLTVILMFSAFASMSIEYSQLVESIFFSGVSRFIETNDVLLNTLGGVLGYILLGTGTYKKQQKSTNRNTF